jgi:UDP-N-acetylmuramate--alanine ligase
MIAKDHLDLSAPRRLHLLGIGGSGMAPFARLLRADGHVVTGADAAGSAAVDALLREGFEVFRGAEGQLIPAGVEGLIHTAAIPAESPVLAHARDAGIPVLKYARAVGLYAESRRVFAVAGTHGKTTTTALLACTMRRAGLDPTFLVGGSAPQLGPVAPGSSRYLVAEACEYDRSFLHLAPEAAIVTNVEADHLDYYRDIVEIQEAFRAFAAKVTGLLVLHEGLRPAIGRASGVRARVVTFGTSPEADLRVLPGPGVHAFIAAGRTWRLKLPGFHNVMNAAAVLAVAREHGLDGDAVADAFETFEGVRRRLQVVGRPKGVPVVDDYAHHPTEVAAGLRALREEYAPRRLWCVFQPHQFSRLRRFLAEFADALAAADRIVVPAIYGARDAEEDRKAVSADDLVNEVRTRGGDAVHIADFQGIVDFVRAGAQEGDVIVTMGAGDVGDVAGRLAAAL